MVYSTGLITKLSLLICVYLVFTQDIYAYLDPGTGSYIFQILIAILAGALFGIKIYWLKIKSFIAYLCSKTKKDDKV